MGYKITIGIGILFIILAFINFASHLYLLGILLFIGGIVSFSMAGKQNKKRIMVQTQGQEQGQHQIVN
ncbi:MAG: hypothetical protein R3321_11930, partial [Nitrososphaeraceae archaeon]|nr:hypothetical protein [Nitrososphaeraceae archaeon]